MGLRRRSTWRAKATLWSKTLGKLEGELEFTGAEHEVEFHQLFKSIGRSCLKVMVSASVPVRLAEVSMHAARVLQMKLPPNRCLAPPFRHRPHDEL